MAETAPTYDEAPIELVAEDEQMILRFTKVGVSVAVQLTLDALELLDAVLGEVTASQPLGYLPLDGDHWLGFDAAGGTVQISGPLVSVLVDVTSSELVDLHAGVQLALAGAA